MASSLGVRRLAAPRWQLAACSAMHVVNDALFAGLYPLLPLMAADLGLSYAEVGAVKAAFSGTSAALQIPAGMAAERVGEQVLLAVGTGWVGIGVVAMALAGSFVPLLVMALLAGAGGASQHPVATAVISRLYETGGRGAAIGTLNFAGDLGKVLAPALAGGLAVAFSWRTGLIGLGAAGAVFALIYLVTVPQPPRTAPAGRTVSVTERDGATALDSAEHHRRGWGITRPRAFMFLTAIGVLDAAARGTSLTFLPFLFEDKGYDATATSFLFGVLFAAGAAGKFVCGPIGDRFGNLAAIVVTEAVTALALIAVWGAPAELVLIALLPLGFMLNGTSSVLYAAVADLVHASRRSRGYGLFFTCTFLASAGAPILYGMLADRGGLGVTFVTLAAATGAIVPLALIAGRDLGRPATAR